MKNPTRWILVLIFIVLSSLTAFAGLSVSSPADGSAVSSPVHVVASANAVAGIAAISVYVDNNSVFLSYSSNVDSYIPMSMGAHYVVVQAWDNLGNVYKQALNISVSEGSGNVAVSSPTEGQNVGSPVHFTASSTSPDQSPITAMQIYVDDQLDYSTGGNQLDTSLNLATGSHRAIVKAWSAAGQNVSQAVDFSVAGGSGGAAVTVTSPANGSGTSSPIHVVGSAQSPAGIVAMHVYLENNDVYQTGTNSVDTYVNASSGSHNLVVQAWDGNGNIYKQPVSVSVNAQPPINGYNNINQMSGWSSCNSCAGAGGTGAPVSYSMTQGVASPSMDGQSAQFWLGGGYPYAGALWWEELTPQPGASHFTYDLQFYYQNAAAPQALEFDVNQVVGGSRYIFGTECNFRETGTWRVWDTTDVRWVDTGIPCSAAANSWNHVTWELQRNGDGSYTFVAITLNGQKNYVNRTYWPISQSGNELNVAVQLDSNYAGTDYSVWVDQIALTYY